MSDTAVKQATSVRVEETLSPSSCLCPVLSSFPPEDLMARHAVSFTAWLQGDPEEVSLYRERVVHVQNALSCSRTEAVTRIFIAGLNAMEANPDLDLDPAMRQIVEQYRAIKRKRSIFTYLDEIFEELGPEEFVEWCERYNIPHQQEFLIRYRYREEQLHWSTRAQIFLRDFLKDGEPHSTEDIRRAAESVGLVASDSDWGRMRTLASRLGLSSRKPYGSWTWIEQQAAKVAK